MLFDIDCPNDVVSNGSLTIKGKSGLHRLFFNDLFLSKGSSRQKPPAPMCLIRGGVRGAFWRLSHSATKDLYQRQPLIGICCFKKCHVTFEAHHLYVGFAPRLLYGIEQSNGSAMMPSVTRRQTRSGPLLAEFKTWLEDDVGKVMKGLLTAIHACAMALSGGVLRAG